MHGLKWIRVKSQKKGLFSDTLGGRSMGYINFTTGISRLPTKVLSVLRFFETYVQYFCVLVCQWVVIHGRKVEAFLFVAQTRNTRTGGNRTPGMFFTFLFYQILEIQQFKSCLKNKTFLCSACREWTKNYAWIIMSVKIGGSSVKNYHSADQSVTEIVTCIILVSLLYDFTSAIWNK